MGQIFQRTYKARDGSVRTCATWTIRYYRNGRAHQETGFSRKGEAQSTLRQREGAVANGQPVSAAMHRLTFDDAAEDVLNDFRVNAKRSLAVVERRITKHLTPWFGGRRMTDISTADVRAFVASRQAQTLTVRKARTRVLPDGRTLEEPAVTKPTSNAEINRELQLLKRCFSLAIQSGKLLTKPHIPMLRESAPRAGFFEAEQFVAVCQHLPEAVRPVVEFAYITGWRVPSEVLPLTWSRVDWKAGTVTLAAGTTKNGEARTFPFTEALRRLLERQDAARKAAQRETGAVVPWVFFRVVSKGRKGSKVAKPIKAFTKAWQAATRAAGCPGRIPHDFRRTAVRNLERAGVARSVAMQLTGHKTESVYRRYAIVAEQDLREAVTKLETAHRDSFVTVASQPAGVVALSR